MKLLENIHAHGSFLVCWNTDNAARIWRTPDGCVSLDATSVEALATAGHGAFVAWRKDEIRPNVARPVVFRLATAGIVLRSFELFVRDHSQWMFRATILAADATEAVGVAMRAGFVFTDDPSTVRVEMLPIATAAHPVRLCLVLAPAATHGGSLMDYETGKTWAVENGLTTHPDVNATAGVRFKFDAARTLAEQPRQTEADTLEAVHGTGADWRFVVEIRFAEPKTRAMLATLKLPEGWSMTFPA